MMYCCLAWAMPSPRTGKLMPSAPRAVPLVPPTAFLAAGTLAVSIAPAEAGDLKEDFIALPEASLYFHNHSTGTAPEHGSDALVDFFLSAEYLRQWRLLSEVVVGGEERDLERLMVGHIDSDGNLIWGGRYHTALGQWNFKFHHGAYLQTTIHRPGIIEWEDEGGVIPAHATGVSVDGQREINSRALGYSVGLGLGPELGNQGKLVAYDLLNAGARQHDVALIGELTSHARDNPFDDTGVFAGYITIPSQAVDIHRVQQTVVGAFINQTLDAVLWRATLFYVADALTFNGGGERSESFTYAYLQPEYVYNAIWTYYGRWERSFGVGNNIYLKQIPSFVTERILIGTRYQLRVNQALKVELANMEQYGQHFLSAEAQWSASLP